MLYLAKYMSPLGMLTLVSDEENLMGLWIDGQKYYGGKLKERLESKQEVISLVCLEADLKADLKNEFGSEVAGELGGNFVEISKKEMCGNGIPGILRKTKFWLDRYFAGEKPDMDELSLAPQGSEFCKMVWGILCEIPYGEVTTYGEIAKKVAERTGKKSMSAQAVGGAVGHNPISIIIPCHRVIGADGSLTGYAGGIEKKVKLLELEKEL